jgi:osmotically inducible lipoprotein OsmB
MANAKTRNTGLAAGLLAILVLGGCSGMSTTEQRVLSGGAIGAGVGVGATVLTGGCIACGAVVGGAAGAAGGYIYDKTQSER